MHGWVWLVGREGTSEPLREGSVEVVPFSEGPLSEAALYAGLHVHYACMVCKCGRGWLLLISWYRVLGGVGVAACLAGAWQGTVLVMGAGASAEPPPRYSHCSAAVEGKLYVWGGKRDEPTSLHVFNPVQESWETKSTTGAPPPGVFNGASASAAHSLYHYSGSNGGSYCGSLHHLDTTTLRWTELPSGPAKEKGYCGMVSCGDMLVLLGGYTGTGRTDELHVFDLKTGKKLYLITNPVVIPLTTCLGTWSSPVVSGTRPPPCDSFSLTMIDDHQAVMFGGIHSGGTSNDVYILDLTRMVR